MRHVELPELLNEMHPSVHDQILAFYENPTTVGLVLLENVDKASLQCGQRSVVRAGSDCTVKTAEECEGRCVNGQHVKLFCLVPEDEGSSSTSGPTEE